MAETQTFTFDKAKLEAHLTSIREYLGTFKGKPGYNPHFFAQEKLAPLIARLEKGEITKELQEAILALKKEEPIAKGAEHNIVKPPLQPQQSGADKTTVEPSKVFAVPGSVLGGSK